MKLAALFDSAKCGPGEFPAAKGFQFPPSIELPHPLYAFMAIKWTESEHKREEIGGNIRLIGGSSPPPSNVVRATVPVARPRSNSAPPALSQPVEFQPTDVTDGQGGNSVSIPSRTEMNIVANFHTHPPTPGGTNPERCGYQPPSIEDVLAMMEQGRQQRDIFVSFVVANTKDVYAIVYVRGISHFTTEDQNKVYFYSGSLQEKGKRIKFPTDQDEEKFLSQILGNPMNRDRINADLERRTNYGEELSKLIWDHLNPVCHIFSLGLYKGDGMVLKRYNY